MWSILATRLNATHHYSTDQSDTDLCHSLANLVAVIIGCQPQSTHLWYHMFAADQLKGTYMTGFMVRERERVRVRELMCPPPPPTVQQQD